MSPDLFLRQYAYTGHPVVVKNVAANWTAKETFNFDFFRELYFSLDSPVLDNLDKDCQFFAWDFHEFEDMDQVFNMDYNRASLVGNYTPW